MKQERMAPMKGSVGIVLLGAVLASLALVRATPSAPKITVHRFGKLTQKNGLLPHRIALSTIRGGYSDQSPGDGVSASGTCASQEYQMPPPQAPQPQQYGYPTDQEPPNKGENVPFEETFQQKVDTWRQYQMEHAEEQRSSLSPRDGQGRMKLLTSVGKGSRAITFFILMWRNVHLYEVVDSRYKGSVRYMGVFPLTFLFIANLAGVVASVSSAGSSSKKRLKAILNLNKLVEIFLIVWHVGKLLFSTSNLVPREIYISNILHSVFFILQCQAVTRFVWDEALPVSTRATGYSNGVNDDDQLIQEQSYPGSDLRQSTQRY